MSVITMRSCAWLMIQAICSGKRRGLTVWQMAPIPMMPYQTSRWRQVFQAIVAARKHAAPLDIFGLGAPRPRAVVHSARTPLPKPRPEEAPKASDKAPDAPAPEAAGADGKASSDKRSPENPAEPAPSPEKQATA